MAMNESLGILFGGIATTVSVIAVVAFACFAFNISFLEKFKVLTGIAALSGGILLAFWILDPTKEVVAGEIVFGDWWGIGFPITILVVLIVCVPLMIVPIFSMFYYAQKNWKEDPILGKRLLLLCLGGLSLAVAYAAEMMGLKVVISTFLRLGYIIAAILFYWAIFKIKKSNIP
jgi:hypothetical protein